MTANTLTAWAQDAVVRVIAGYSAAGSGFIFDTTGETGFVVTNYHVVEDDPGDIDVKVMGRTYTGTLLGYNSEEGVDVAVVSICCDANFHALPWEKGGRANPGVSVMAMGRPRDVPVSTTGTVVDDFLADTFDLVAHDAPLQQGSSGGPVLTMDGKILGVNVASSKLTDGLFYAVPYQKIATQVADWKSRLVVVGSTPAPVITAPSELTISGTGNTDRFWNIPKGRYIVTVTVRNNQDRYVTMNFEHTTEGESWLESEWDVASDTFTYLVNVGDGSERSYERDLLAGRQLVKVQATGSWSIAFEPAQ